MFPSIFLFLLALAQSGGKKTTRGGVEKGEVLINRGAGGSHHSCNYALITREEVSRAEAMRRCEAKGGTLAILRTGRDNHEVTQLLRTAGQEKAWIGLFVSGDSKTWEDGSELAFSRLPHDGYYPASGVEVLASVTGEWLTTETKILAPFLCSLRRKFMVGSGSGTRASEAADRCPGGLSLARVTGARDVADIRRTTQYQSHATWFWVDGRDAVAQGQWLWSDGTEAADLRWEKSVTFPTEGPLYAGYSKTSGRVRPLHGYFSLPVLCQCPASLSDVPLAQSDYGNINSEGVYVPLFRTLQENRLRSIGLDHEHSARDNQQGLVKYTYHFLLLTHGEAQNFCSSRGGNLACPRDSIQQARIVETIRSNSWLGVVDVDEEGVYRCLGNNEIATYTNWYHRRFGRVAKPEPDNMTDRMKPGANYVQILYDPQRPWRHGRWIDRGAPQYEFVVKSGFVCENPVW